MPTYNERLQSNNAEIESLKSKLGALPVMKREQEKLVEPTKIRQEIVPAVGYTLSAVTVEAIPDKYITTTDANAVASDMATGKTAYVNGEKVTGTIPFTKDKMYGRG